jgi:hypothetical protein
LTLQFPIWFWPKRTSPPIKKNNQVSPNTKPSHSSILLLSLSMQPSKHKELTKNLQKRAFKKMSNLFRPINSQMGSHKQNSWTYSHQMNGTKTIPSSSVWNWLKKNRS